MANTLSWDAAETTYLDTTNLIDAIVAKFCRRYGRQWVARSCGSLDEVRSQADWLFLSAYESYDPDRASFTTWLHEKVWNGLLSLLRNSLKRRAREALVTQETLDENANPLTSDFDLSDFMLHLSEDAREVVSILCVDTPQDIYLTLAQNLCRGETPAALKEAVKEYLLDTGWAAGQIAASFQEVKEALCR